jgi:DNA-binding NarL/FixJ family response regulator
VLRPTRSGAKRTHFVPRDAEDAGRYGGGAVRDDLSANRRAAAVVPAIVLIEPRLLIREWLVRWLKALSREAVISVFKEASALLQSGAALGENSLILVSICAADVFEPDMLGQIRGLADRFPGTPVVALSDVDKFEAGLATIRHGARGYIPTTIGPAVASAAIKLIRAGGTFISAASLSEPVVQGANGAVTPGHTGGPRSDLNGNNHNGENGAAAVLEGRGHDPSVTPREAEVLTCLRAGKQNKLIAFELNMRESTVKVHVRHLMRKFRASNRTQLALHGSARIGR